MFENSFIKFVWVIFYVPLILLVNMCCFYVGWNRGVLPLISNGIQKIEFWNTFYLMVLCSGIFTPVTIAIKTLNTKR